MLKPKSKQELVQALSKADVLNLVIEVIERKETAAAKKIRGNNFIKNLQDAVNDQRDIILVCIKLR